MFPRRLLFKEKTHILASVNKNKIYNVFFSSQSQTPLVHLCAILKFNLIVKLKGHKHSRPRSSILIYQDKREQ